MATDLKSKLKGWESSRLSAAAALAAVAAVCASQLSVRSAWGDEFCTYHAVTLPFPAAWKYIIEDVHPPLYFMLLRVWVLVFGSTVESMRAISIVFIVGGLGVVYVTARRYFSAAAGLWAVIFFGLTPFLIYHSVHARMYALLFLFAALLIYAGLRARETGRPRYFALFALAGAGLLYTQYVSVFLVAGALAGSVALSLRRRRELIGWISAGAAIAALFAPWVPYFQRQTQTAMITEGSARFAFQPHHLKYFAKIASPFDHSQWLPLLWFGALAAAVLVIVGGVRAARGEHRQAGRWVVAITVASVGLFIAAATVKPLVVTRTMIWFLPSFALFVGLALAALPARGRAAAGVALVVGWVVIFPDLNLYRLHTDWRAAVQSLARDYRPGDVVMLDRSITVAETWTLRYYLDRTPARDLIVLGRTLFRPRADEPPVQALPPDPRRRWFFLEPSDHPSAGLHQSLQDLGFVMQERRTWFEVGLTRYAPRERTLFRAADGALSPVAAP